MTDPDSVFNGIHATTGGALYPAPTLEALLALAERQQTAPPRTGPFSLARVRQGARGRRQTAVPRKRDFKDLAKSGWGVIFAAGADCRIREALKPLLDHRKEQVTRFDERMYHEFSGERGYQRGDAKEDFFDRHCPEAPYEFHPEQMPYYLLLVGGPEEIPFDFQGRIDGRYAVGRLSFDRVEDYARYAAQVVASEKQTKHRRLRATVFGVSNADDRAMELTCEYLAKRVADNLTAMSDEFEVEKVLGVAATKDRLRRLLGGDRTPDLLFTTCHGMGFDPGDLRQEAEQGALVCADWPGPRAWSKELTEDHYFSARDVGDDARLGGLITFHFACHSAGTPAEDAYSERPGGKRHLAPKPMVARLCKRILAHPAGGALAVVGHVERTWGYSFLWKGVGPTTQAFEWTLESLLAGDPVGFAMEPFAARAYHLQDDLYSRSRNTPRSAALAQKVAMLWTALQDARNYVILGDPAVRLPAVRLPSPGPILLPHGCSRRQRRVLQFERQEGAQRA